MWSYKNVRVESYDKKYMPGPCFIEIHSCYTFGDMALSKFNPPPIMCMGTLCAKPSALSIANTQMNLHVYCVHIMCA